MIKIKCATDGCVKTFVKYWGKEYCSGCALDRRRLYNRNKIREKLSDPLFRAEHGKRVRERQRLLKIKVLTHYGKNGELKCCWPGCEVDDNDCLTLDHINNDGAKQRKKFSGNEHEGTGPAYNYFIVRSGFPKDLQTLCANHQLKKETLRKRKKADENYRAIVRNNRPSK